MEYKICPICDRKIKGKYCSNCKRWVRKPLTVKVDYYLNERHSQEWHDCEYHDGVPYNPRAEAAKSAPKRRPPQNTRGTQSSRRTETSAQMRSAKKQPAKKQKEFEKKKNTAWGILTALLIILVSFFIEFGQPLWNAFQAAMEAEGFQIGQKIPETAVHPDSYEPEWDGEYSAEYDAEEYSEEVLTDEQVMELGKECSLNGHFSVTEDIAEDELKAYLESCGFTVTAEDRYSHNTVSSTGDTWFQTTYECGASDGDGTAAVGIAVYSDTYSGQVHEICVYSDNWEECLDTADAALELLTDLGDIPDRPAEADNYRDLMEAETEEDYYYVYDPVLEERSVDIWVNRSEYSDGIVYSIDIWKFE